MRGFLSRRNTKKVSFLAELGMVEDPFCLYELVKVPASQNRTVIGAELRLGLFKLDAAGRKTVEKLREDEGIQYMRAFFDDDTDCVYTGMWRMPDLQSNRNSARSFRSNTKEKLKEYGGPEGYGIQQWPNGSVYQGMWSEGKANGYGRYILMSGDVYWGNWKADKAHGFGEYLYKDGTRYKGEWKDDKFHGEGAEAWPDGSRFTGVYKSGMKCGQGTFVWEDGA